jgi:RHS repeat-associated protein
VATYAFQPVNASLLITDTPVGHAPPRGPAVPFTLRYDLRQNLQPQMPTYGHLGPQWTHDWLSYVRELPAWCEGGYSSTNNCYPASVSVYLRGGGQEGFQNPNAAGVYPRHWRVRSQLVRVSTDPIRYERRLADDSVEVFGLSDGAPAGQRRLFLTEVRDVRGQAVTLTYDAQFRLVALTDAVGQVTTLEYGWPDDPLLLTHITDPFGRTATLTYTPAGQLARITDVLGLSSTFGYLKDDFIGSLTTPYGTTTFRQRDDYWAPMIEATDALGGTTRLEFRWEETGWPQSEPAAEVPTGFTGLNAGLHRYNSLYWDARAWARAPGDEAAAVRTRWLTAVPVQSSTPRSVTIPHSVVRPGERRVWYAYPGQSGNSIGWSTVPSEVARVLADGTTQRTRTTVNPQGHVTSRIDPLGRTTTYSYAANGIDLLEVRQTTGGADDVLARYADYTAGHQPQTVTDAAGQTTTLTSTATGEVATVTNARGETTTYAYDGDGRLTSVMGPVAGATTRYTYDGYGRVRMVTTEGATVTTEYDLFDRPTAVWYPDGTVERTTYDRLDVATRTDRLGRVTRYVYDPLRRLAAVRDPAGRLVRHAYGPAGDQLIDANGQATTWERDVAGRVVREVRADGLTTTQYTYDVAGRLATVTDPKGQVTTYTYALDDAVTAIVWTEALVPTASVSYTYDAGYPRVTSMTDGTGETAYTYHPAGQLGAGQVATVDGPLPDDTIGYTYDVLGRVVGRTIHGAANAVTVQYDALGRVTEETTVLGTFAYAYDGASGRLAAVTSPNGQTSTYDYLPAGQDHRLASLHHRLPGGATLSRFAYTYDAVGNILTWDQQAGEAAPMRWTYGYDAADQLTRAVQATTEATPQVVQRYAYGYDPAGNRRFEQIDDQVTAWTYDRLNRLLTQAGGGMLQVGGMVSEPAAVLVNGQVATVSGDLRFTGALPVVPGTNVFTITATDPSGNTATATYEVDVADAPRTFTYDANGNLTSDGTRTFEWDARNQLVAVSVGTHRSEFVYDGLQRRVRQVEKDDGATTADTRVLWCETAICEERAADGVTVTRRAFGLGEQINGQARFFTTDHLGSVREVTDSAGTLLARYAFDPWGRRTVTAGTDVTTVGYAAYKWQGNNAISLTLHRGYDAELGRWLSQDPIGLRGGSNLFAYAENDPVQFNDPLGLAIWICNRKAFTQYGPGNHSYFWDDRNGRCCGRGSTSSCSEGGPTKDSCRKIADSDGKEDELLTCCKNTADWGPWFPPINDCHEALDDCLQKSRLKNPGAPGGRVGRPCDPCSK